MTRSALLVFLLLITAYINSFAQPTTLSSTISNGNHVQYTINNPQIINGIPAATFTILGDGRYTINPNPTHDYQSIAAFEPEVYSLAAYQPTSPVKLIDPTNPSGQIFVNSITSTPPLPPPYISPSRHVKVGQSWRAADGNEWIYMITFRHPGGNVSGNVGGSIDFALDNNLRYLGRIEPQGSNSNWVSVSSEPAIGSLGGSVRWNFSNLNTTDIRTVYVRVELPANSNIKSLSSNTSVIWQDSQENIEEESTPVDSDVFIAAHDPNKIIVHTPCLEGEYPGLQKLEYTIHFQNIGSYYANTVQIAFHPHWSFLLNSVDVIKTSAPISGIEIDPITGYIYFTLPNINLPGMQQWYPYSYSPDQTTGYLTFSICVDGMIPSNFPIEVDADIYFDQLPAVNTGITTFHTSDNCAKIPVCDDDLSEAFNLEIPQIEMEDADLSRFVHVYPNPVAEKLNIDFKMTEIQGGIVHIDLYNSSGQLQKTIFKGTKNNGNHNIDINISDLPASTYFLKMQVGNQYITKRFIKME